MSRQSLTRSISALLILIAICFIENINAARNSQEEAICQPFLTSKTTSPLIANLKRNLTIDEDGNIIEVFLYHCLSIC